MMVAARGDRPNRGRFRYRIDSAPAETGPVLQIDDRGLRTQHRSYFARIVSKMVLRSVNSSPLGSGNVAKLIKNQSRFTLAPQFDAPLCFAPLALDGIKTAMDGGLGDRVRPIPRPFKTTAQDSAPKPDCDSTRSRIEFAALRYARTISRRPC